MKKALNWRWYPTYFLDFFHDFLYSYFYRNLDQGSILIVGMEITSRNDQSSMRFLGYLSLSIHLGQICTINQIYTLDQTHTLGFFLCRIGPETMSYIKVLTYFLLSLKRQSQLFETSTPTSARLFLGFPLSYSIKIHSQSKIGNPHFQNSLKWKSFQANLQAIINK